jgi:MazG family protein
VTNLAETAGTEFAELVRIMQRLRAPGGCPWDLKQTFDSIKPYTLEETYEVLDAIDARDWDGLKEELGDFILQAVFYAEIAASEGLFQIADSLRAINQKLIRRHPHVFADATAETPEDVKVRWDEIKRQEKSGQAKPQSASILEGVPRSLPALVEAEKISSKAAAVGFEWPNISGVLEKLQEEAKELTHARENLSTAEVEHEIGDLLFTVANLARFLKIDPEQALRKTNARFRKRFAFVEAEAGDEISRTPLDRLEASWQQAKRTEKTSQSEP